MHYLWCASSHKTYKRIDMTLIDTITNWYAANMNYASITALMAIESSFIPCPSEVVIPPAVYVAATPTSPLCVTGNYIADVALIVLFGTYRMQPRTQSVARLDHHIL